MDHYQSYKMKPVWMPIEHAIKRNFTERFFFKISVLQKQKKRKMFGADKFKEIEDFSEMMIK